MTLEESKLPAPQLSTCLQLSLQVCNLKRISSVLDIWAGIGSGERLGRYNTTTV